MVVLYSDSSYDTVDIKDMINSFWKSNPDNKELKKKILEDEVFILGKDKLDKQAIEKLISLREFNMAQEYCSTKPGKNLLTELFKQYIQLHKEEKGIQKTSMQKLILNFLQTYSTHPELDPAEVLENIPDDWLLSDGGLSNYLMAAFSQTDYRRKNTKAKRQLTEMNLQNSNYNLTTAQKAWIKLTDKDTCAVSSKKIGEKVFDVYPNGVLIMHSYMNNASVCPITGQNFAHSCYY